MNNKQIIPILDLKAQYASIEKEVDEAIKKVLRSGQFILGPEVEALEKEIAALCGCKYGIGVSSGTDALLLSLTALGIGPGDEVITTPFTFIATASCILHCGAKPVFVDIDPRTFNIDPKKIEEAITKKTKAIIPVHLYGQPADMDEILEIAKAHNLFIIEDAAQAIGAKYKGKPVGQFGITGCLSFFPTKNLGAYGDGGMVVTNDAAVAEKIDMLRRHGCKKKYRAELLGFNSRLDELQAAILRVKLKYLEKWTEARRQAAHRYNELLEDVPGIITPYEDPGGKHVYHQYTIRVLDGKRDEVKEFLAEHGIGTMVYYPIPMHKLPIYKEEDLTLPIAEQLTDEVLSLPIWPGIGKEIQERVVEEIGNQMK